VNIYFSLLPDGSKSALIENVKAGEGNDILRGNAAGNRLSGGRGEDVPRGGNGADTLIGNSGAGRLFGGKGNDLLDGGPGRDQLSGGLGADIFVFSQNSGRDRIRGFNIGEDRVSLDHPEAATVIVDAGRVAIALGEALLVFWDIEPDSYSLDDFL
jgi:Ca2+-binding RTX toxin-like protein